jgi:hypothetical protein
MKVDVLKEHQWLQQLIGEWTYEGRAEMGPDQPAHEAKGEESVRGLGEVWVVGEARGEMPGDGGTGYSIVTLGYDAAKQKFVGTWVGSMMANMFVYEGTLDETGKVLTLDTEGPDMSCDPAEMAAGKTARYQDVVEIESPDRRTLTSRMLGPDGEWREFMKLVYRRKS